MHPGRAIWSVFLPPLGHLHLKQLTTENNRSLLYGSVGTQATTNSSTYQLGQIGGQFPQSRSNPFTCYAHTSLPANIRTQQLIYLEPKIVTSKSHSSLPQSGYGIWFWLATAISHLISAVQKWKKTTLTSHLVIKFSSLICQILAEYGVVFPRILAGGIPLSFPLLSCIWRSTKHCSLIFTTYWGFLQWYWRKYTAVPDC